MAVPNTNTFSLQDVVNEINPLTNDLVACIASAIEPEYDTNYYSAPATSLLEFRNYGSGSGPGSGPGSGLGSITFNISNSTPIDDCNNSPTTYPIEVKANIAYPNIGDTISYASGAPFPGNGNGWHWRSRWIAYKINSAGTIIDKVDCT